MLNFELSRVNLVPYLDFLKNKSVCIFGASGLIGRYFLYLLLFANQNYSLNMKVHAVVHREASRDNLQAELSNLGPLTFSVADLQKPLSGDCDFDLVVQGASPADPLAYSTNPVGTFLTNVLGCKNVLDWMEGSKGRMVYLSSGEVYGLTQPGPSGYSESDYGYIDYLTPRACYSMGKRAAETLCRLYVEQKEMNAVIARLCHVYGPTISRTNSRADAQFLRLAVKKEDIIMKSKGEQLRSYCYVSDACTGILSILKNGNSGEAYNIANARSVASIYEFARHIAQEAGVNISFSNPSMLEAKGFSKVSRAVLDSEKLQSIGWQPEVSLTEGVARMLAVSRLIR